MSEDLNDFSTPESAAAVGKFPIAIRLKLEAIKDRAMEVLAETGVFERVFVNAYTAQAAHNPALPPLAFLDALVDHDWDALVVAAEGAVAYLQSRPVPPEDAPWPLEFAAAHLLLDIFVMGSRVRVLRRRLIGRATVDLVGIAEVVWIALRIGAMSEAFRADHYEFGAVDALGLGQSVEAATKALADRERGQAKGAAAMADKANLWRVPALEIANEQRAANRVMGDEPLAQKVCSALVAREDVEVKPAEATVRKQIRRWIATEKLPASLSRPPPKGDNA